MDRIDDAVTFISKKLYLKKPRVANFPEIIKISTMVIKTISKDSEKLKELEIMYKNAIYMCTSSYNKSC